MIPTISDINQCLTNCMNGDLALARSIPFQMMLNEVTMDLLRRPWDAQDTNAADMIIRISNILYNNSTYDTLPLDDGIYDQLMVKIRYYMPNYSIGAIPTPVPEVPQNENVFTQNKIMCSTVDFDKGMYTKDIWAQNVPIQYGIRKRNMCVIVRDPITKRMINTQHKYPELVGTLDKCRFTLNAEAIDAGALNNSNTPIFERDYIHKCIDAGVISVTEQFEMIGELKYDGISVEAEVCGDRILTALSRGDTADNIATDLTPILSGYRFQNAKNVPTDKKFGIKFEAVILKHDLMRLSEIRGKSYKNCRNAIIGLFSSSDAYLYIDYITLIPLSTSLDMPRIDELRFLNTYYNSTQYNRFCVFRGNYQQILFQVKEFVKSAENIRTILPYMIDGVVISFTDPKKIAKLGRENFVNKYQMAIKFNPTKTRTIFLGYTFNIGKTGEVIPMAHFKPCEFIGTIHDEQTIHSYQRFRDLNLAVGQEIDVEYRNDVITYITKPDTEHNRRIMNPPVPFISVCPYCGSSIVLSDSGKSARCPNIACPERNIARITDMIDYLGFDGFSEKTVRAMGLTSLKNLIDGNFNMHILGPKEYDNFMARRMKMITTPIPDYKLMSAIGFEGIAEEKWKSILKNMTIDELLGDERRVVYALASIKGIGQKTATAIVHGLRVYRDDIIAALTNIPIVNSKGAIQLPKVVFTGFRDPEFADLLLKYGFDASGKSVTKDTMAVIAANPNENSKKLDDAHKKGIPVYSRSEFMSMYNIILQ